VKQMHSMSQAVPINTTIPGAENRPVMSWTAHVLWKSLVRCSLAEASFLCFPPCGTPASSSYFQRRNHKTIMKDKQAILKMEERRTVL
jgi:hypothetical protein